MKIYTYYEDIKFPHQKEMLNLWQTSWKNAGFQPFILSKQDAQKSNFYEEFVEKIKSLHFQIMSKEINNYGLSCYLRWLAYSTQQDEYFYVSDYDVLNNKFNNKEKPDVKLHFMSGACPCFVSGNQKQFENFCKLVVKISYERLDVLKKLIEQNFIKHYHDQEFVLLNLMKKFNQNYQSLKDDNEIKISTYAHHDYTKDEMPKVPHISHNYVKLKLKSNDTIDELRIKIMKGIVEGK